MKNRQRTHRVLLILAIFSFIIAAVQGMIYYSGYDTFFKLLLVLQNSINAFGFKATISIKDVVAFINKDPSAVNLTVGYAYCIAVFTAPYCTVSFLYKFLERILRFFVSFRRKGSCGHIVIFGYNDDVKSMIANTSAADLKKVRIHIVTAADIGHAEVYRLNKSGFAVHCVDVLKLPENELPEAMDRICADVAENLLLFEDSSIRNFSLLQLFRLNEADSSRRLRLRSGAKVSCRCEEEGISRLISGYYDKAAGTDAFYDLELISLPELQIHRMYSEHPLQSCYSGRDVPLREQTVHLLVGGLGKLGQQAVLQAMNLGVVHENNRIVIDVFDKDIKNRRQHFTRQFSEGAFTFTDDSMTLRSDTADGELTVNFFGIDAGHRDFYSTVRSRNRELPYTYAVITFGSVDMSVECAMDLNMIFCEENGKVPLLVRMDADRRLAEYIKGENDSLADLEIIDDRSCVISLEMIINRSIDRRAKDYNHFYNNIAIITGNETGNSGNSDADPEREWNSIRMFKRSSSKAAAYHDEVKDVIIPALASECGVQLSAKLSDLLGENGSLMRYTGSAWRMEGTEHEVLEKLCADRFAYELAALEHRRWCCYMASVGWRYGERSDKLRCNPCLVTQEKLMETRPEMCKYDLMSLMARYLSDRGKR
ncbi:MAG: hypothetical protein IKO47_04620 [Ruminococcus sp.]|nr:hypothetical protein [Ruminococcus sp.]